LANTKKDITTLLRQGYIASTITASPPWKSIASIVAVGSAGVKGLFLGQRIKKDELIAYLVALPCMKQRFYSLLFRGK
jgi:hypothetical protein